MIHALIWIAAMPAAAALPTASTVQQVSADPRIQVVQYAADQIVRLEAAVGYQLAIELAADEEIRTVALGDSSAWAATTSRSGSQLFVKPLQAGASTNMTVVTSARRYVFDLSATSQPSGATAYSVRFVYPDAAPLAEEPQQVVGEYQVRGARALIPVRMSDDGVKTYITWSPDAPLPAVYSIDSLGRESLSNGQFRGDTYVIDSVSERLIFRLDKSALRAERRPVEKP